MLGFVPGTLIVVGLVILGVVLLAYAGEDHGLRKKANQIDYQQRILQWFGHYLKNEPPQPWIVNGVSVLEREQELKRASKKGS